MTTDILPTVLTELGFESSALSLDGVDLGHGTFPADRPRLALASRLGQIRAITMEESQAAWIARRKTRQLRLEDGEAAIWRIGPMDQNFGKSMSSLCTPRPSNIRYVPLLSEPLEHAPSEEFVPAFVAGRVSGAEAPAESRTFLVSNNDRFVASGSTWKHRKKWQYFALVDPALASGDGWAPEVVLLEGDECLVPGSPARGGD